MLRRIYFESKISKSLLWSFYRSRYEIHCVWFWPRRTSIMGPLCFISEVSWLSGREEAVWIPPPETITYQRPDHRLWPSTRAVVVTILGPEQGRLDQKTPNGPKGCPAGLLRHYRSGERQRGREGHPFFPKVSWDHQLIIKRGPFIWWVLAATAGFYSAVKGLDHSVKAKSVFSLKVDVILLPNFISFLYLVRTNKRWFMKVLTSWYNQSEEKNRSLYWTLNWLKDKVTYGAAQCNQIQ